MLRFKPLDPEHAWRRDALDDAWRGIRNPFVCHFGTSQGSTTQTNVSQPWTAQQPYLTTGFSAASNLLDQAPPTQTYPVAPLNSIENSALSGITNLASSGTPITQSASTFANDLENGSLTGANNPSNGYFSSLAGSNLGLNNPGTSTLESYANGNQLNSNGYSDPTAQSIISQVAPQVAAQFNAGNDYNNPAAAYSAANGITAALAPIEYQNYQTQEGLQQSAANQLGANALAGGQLQSTAASGLATNANTGVTQQIQGNALAPQDQALSYGDLQQLFNAGQVQQTQAQNEATGAAQQSNYAALSPYQQLQSYMQDVTGSYGSTGSTTSPYFTNNTANTLGTAAGGLGILGTLGNAVGGSTGIGAGLASLFAFL